MSRIRVYGYKGMVQTELVLPKQYSSDSVFLLNEPYEWVQGLDLTGPVAVATLPQANDKATIVRVEVPDQVEVRFELNPNGPNATTTRVANNDSPRLSGNDQFAWQAGATMSFIVNQD